MQSTHWRSRKERLSHPPILLLLLLLLVAHRLVLLILLLLLLLLHLLLLLVVSTLRGTLRVATRPSIRHPSRPVVNAPHRL